MFISIFVIVNFVGVFKVSILLITDGFWNIEMPLFPGMKSSPKTVSEFLIGQVTVLLMKSGIMSFRVLFSEKIVRFLLILMSYYFSNSVFLKTLQHEKGNKLSFLILLEYK